MTLIFYNEYRNFGDLTKFRCFSPYFSAHAHKRQFSSVLLQFWQRHLIEQPGLLIRVKNFDYSRVTWDHQSSCHVTNGFPRCGFLLVVNMNRPCISHGILILSFKDIWVTTLTFWGHVTSSVTWPLDSQYGVSYRWSIWTDRLSRTVFEILSFKCIEVTTLTFRVTWGHRSYDHWIPKVWFPICSQYEPTMYLAWLLRYWA